MFFDAARIISAAAGGFALTTISPWLAISVGVALLLFGWWHEGGGRKSAIFPRVGMLTHGREAGAFIVYRRGRTVGGVTYGGPVLWGPWHPPFWLFWLFRVRREPPDRASSAPLKGEWRV